MSKWPKARLKQNFCTFLDFSFGLCSQKYVRFCAILWHILQPFFPLLQRLSRTTSRLSAAYCDVFSHFAGCKEKHLAAARICQTERHIAGIRAEKCLAGSCVVIVTARVIAAFVRDDIWIGLAQPRRVYSIVKMWRCRRAQASSSVTLGYPPQVSPSSRWWLLPW